METIKNKLWLVLVAAILVIAVVVAAVLLLPKDTDDDTGAASQPDNTPKTLIFIPDSVTVHYEKWTDQYTLEYEDDWQNKDSFTVVLNPSEDNHDKETPTITFSDKYAVVNLAEDCYYDVTYDEKGNRVNVHKFYIDDGMLDNVEIKYVYDKYSRLTGMMQITVFRGNSNPGVQSQSYAYTYIEEGSQGTHDQFGMTYTRTYNKSFQLIWEERVSAIGEIHRTEYAYDEYGNLLTETQYHNGEKDREVIYTYKAVETTDEVIAHWVQFNSNQ